MLRVRSLRAGYGGVEVLKGVSLHVDAGEIVAIVGANGAGKSTLLNAVAGLAKPWSGSVMLGGVEIAGERAEAVAGRGCVLVPEGRQIFPGLSVRDNLLLGGWLRVRREGRRAVERDIASMEALFPVLAERRLQAAGTLSGGEQQMLAIARALMSRPSMLLLDEPSIGLAPLVVRQIFATVTGLRKEGRTIMLVEQNARAALAVADRGYVMETGQVVLEGTAAELAANRDVQRAYLGKEYRRIEER
jgi:branched-chain amino acid transport system ATP-binding protein